MNTRTNSLNFERKPLLIPFFVGVVIALYALARLGHGPFPFGATRVLKIVEGIAIALVSWFLSSRRRTASLNFERKIFTIPFGLGIILAIYAFARLGHGPFPFAAERIQKSLTGLAIALASWFFGSRKRVESLNFERKVYLVPFWLGIMIAVYALTPLAPSSLRVSILTVGIMIAMVGWMLGSKQRALRAQGWIEGWIKAIAFKTEPNRHPADGFSRKGDNQERSSADHYFVIVVAVAVVACAVLWVFFAPIYLSVDDVVMFNPVYMYLHTGAMTFPAYNDFHAMVVHPPTHYLVLAWLLKAGVPLQYVGSVPPFLFILLTTILLTHSSFAPEIKLALLFGFFAGALFFFWRTGPIAVGMRPDIHLAFAWFAGLVALETGRVQSWDSLRLGLGAFLLTYASGIHYPGSFAWTGVLVYLVWLVREMYWLKQERGWSRALRPVWALLLGACAFGVPYLLLWVIPYWGQIVPFVRSSNATAGLQQSLGAHITSYHTYYASFAGWFMKSLYFPLDIGLPTVLISTAILLPIKQIRGLALASLPNVLFLLLFVSRKLSNNMYFLPEMMMYMCSLGILFAVVCRAAFGRLWPQHRSALVAFVSIVLGGALILGIKQEGAGTISLKPRPNTLAIARAAGRQILGPNALVGARLGRFYVNGGDLSYLLEPDLLWRDIGDMDLKTYFDKFDALVEDTHMSNVTANGKNETLGTWYSEGMLHLRGFFISDLAGDYLLLNANPSDHLQGYGLHGDGQVVHFSQRADADWVFLAVVCNRGELNSLGLSPVFQRTYLLPERGSVQKQLEVLVMRNKDYQPIRALVTNRCIIRNEVPMAMETVDSNQLLTTLKNDHIIKFYQTLDEAIDAKVSHVRMVVPQAAGQVDH